MQEVSGRGSNQGNPEATPLSLEDGRAQIDTTMLPYMRKVNQGIDQQVFDRQKLAMGNYISAYDVIFKMCVQREPYNYSSQMYELFGKYISRFLNEYSMPALSSLKDSKAVDFLKEWADRWVKHRRMIITPATVFRYLDMYYVPNNNVDPVRQYGYKLSKTIVYDTFKEKAVKSILDCISSERDGVLQERDLIHDSVHAIVDLGYNLHKDPGPHSISLYTQDFEVKFIEETRLYYRRQCRLWLDQDSCPDYLKKAARAIEEEQDRLRIMLHESSTNPLLQCCREEILKNNQKELLQKKSGIDDMLQRRAVSDLVRLYRLYSQVQDGLVLVSEMFREHIKVLGFNLIEQSKNLKKEVAGSEKGLDQHQLIMSLIDLHDLFRNIVRDCFKKDQIFEKALKEAFEDFINKEFYTSNLLAKFINDVLTKDSKIQLVDMEKTLDHVVTIYGYIRQKDVFEEKYHSFLANRLLTQKSNSDHAEKNMIGKLKNEAGYQWTSKLETMFKDVLRSKELLEEFNKQYQNDFSEELIVIVCTSGCWPTSGVPSLNVAPELSPICDKFRDFYLNKHAGTKLSWALHQGDAEITVQFNPSTERLLVVTTFQMMIMLLFNHKKIFKFSEIEESTQIPKKDLIAHILSLAHPKLKVLLKKPNVKEVNDDDEFAINSKFTSKSYRVVVGLLVKAVGDESSDDKVSAMVAIQRRHQIDASIVRVMKTRLRLGHNQLIADVVKQLQRFKPDAGDIKKRIEALIEQEYLERDVNDRKMYNYLA